jgi:DNA-binding XRE family transcriptional regulator
MNNRISILLMQSKLTQKDLAKIMKEKGRQVDHAFLNKVISGKRKPPVWIVFAIPFIFNKSVEEVWFPEEKDIWKSN